MVPSMKNVFSWVRWGLVCSAVTSLGACGGSSSDESSTGGSSAGGTSAGGGGSGGGGTSAGGSPGGGAPGGGAPGGGGVAGGGGTTSGGGTTGIGGATAEKCFGSKYDGLVYVDYDKFNPVVNSTCSGTNHQDIKDPEKLVFLGDSITVGTFPTPANQVYRELLTVEAKAKWPSIEVASCAVNGAQTDDFFAGDNQIPKCFPAAEPKKTLVVMTMGGNDIKSMASKKLGATEALAAADPVLANMDKAVKWLKDPVNFPNGSFVVFANIYEYTDLTANLSACPTAGLIGLTGTWEPATATLIKLREGYMKIATDTKADMIFLGDVFCGHGYAFGDTTGQCYEPGSQNWFDISCIHPTPEGHKQVKNLFWNTIIE